MLISAVPKIDLNVKKDPAPFLALTKGLVEGAKTFARLREDIGSCPVMDECDRIREMLRGFTSVLRIIAVVGHQIGQLHIDEQDKLTLISGIATPGRWSGHRLIRGNQSTRLAEIYEERDFPNPFVSVARVDVAEVGGGVVDELAIETLDQRTTYERGGYVRVYSDEDFVDTRATFPLLADDAFPPVLRAPVQLDGTVQLLPAAFNLEIPWDQRQLNSLSAQLIAGLLAQIHQRSAETLH